MSKIVAAAAIRGARKVAQEAETFLNKAIQEKGKEAKVGFLETAFYLPMAYALLGAEVKTLNDMLPILEHLKSLLHDEPTDKLWLPYLGDALDSGIATLLAEELIVALRYLYGQEPQPDCNGFFSDTVLRSLGIQLVDGRMPGFAAILGAAPDNKTAVEIVREFQKRNILTFVGSSTNGRSIIDQLKEEKVEMGWDTYIVPYGRDTITGIYPLHWAIRGALTFGGHKKGEALKCLKYCKDRVFAFGLALGEVDDVKYATGAGAINMGFPVIADTDIPQILPTGICTYEHLVKERDYKKIVPLCIETRGVKVKLSQIPIPVAYSAAFEGERVRKEQMYIQFGGKYTSAFEYARMKKLDEVQDGKIEVVGPEIDDTKEGDALPLGILVEVAGRKMQKDFEPILERQVHLFLNEAMGIFHMGQRDMCWIRISKDAQKKGLKIKHFGTIIHARLHDTFGKIVDKAQVILYTKKEDVEKVVLEARQSYGARDARTAGMTDEAVDTFYSCTLCQSFAPNHVCIVKPQRLGLCGAYSYLDAKASNELNPTGPNQPVKKGECLDPVKGEWKGVNDFVYQNSNKSLERFHGYSIMTFPETSCCVGSTEVIIDGKVATVGEFINRHQGGEKYAKSSVLTLKNGKTIPEKIVAMQKFPAPKNLVRVNTKSGAEIVLTEDHKIAIDKPEGLSWVRADQVLSGDRTFSIKRLKLPSKAPEIRDLIPDDFPIKAASLPASLNADIFYLAGLISSDGSISRLGRRHYKICFVNTNEKLISVFRDTYRRVFPGRSISVGVKAKVKGKIGGREINSSKSCYVCQLNNLEFGAILDYFGIKVGYKGKWNLSRLVNLPQNWIAAYLAGVFDGDGSVRLRKYAEKWNIGEAYLCIEEKKAVFHLQLLLKRLGIVGNIHKSGPVYKIVMHGANLVKFAKEISVQHPEKRKILEEIKTLPHDNKVGKTQEQVLPLTFGKILTEIPESKNILSPTTHFYYKNGRSRPVMTNLVKVLDSLPQEKRVLLEPMRQTDYFLDIVRKVEKFQNNNQFKYVYNLTTSDEHCYFANSLLIKNCGCFECIIAILPEANGFMVVNREYSGMTPCGMTFSTLAGSVGGGAQTPGFMGVGRLYLVSKKFISADGGLKRIVWMTKELKESLGDKLTTRCQEEGDPDLINKIADESAATSSDELIKHLEKVAHPALKLPPLM